MSDWKVGDRIEARVIAVLNGMSRVQIASENCAREAWIPLDALTRAADPAPLDAAEREVVEAAKAEVEVYDKWVKAPVDTVTERLLGGMRQRAIEARLTAVRRLLALASTSPSQLRADAEILATALVGRMPDRNTQTPEEVAETEAIIEAAIERCLPRVRVGRE